MYARAGDLLVVDGDSKRFGLILEVPHADGTPPYVVRWQPTGHIAMVSPGQFARVIRGEDLSGEAEVLPPTGGRRPRQARWPGAVG
jgi:hypothetical protein